MTFRGVFGGAFFATLGFFLTVLFFALAIVCPAGVLQLKKEQKVRYCLAQQSSMKKPECRATFRQKNDRQRDLVFLF